ncbi:MAG: hypothetical protein L6R48_08290 [Planctomycetes bacterium]|nr:hypothetical protein [Planctomycetota bacterium]
MNDNAAQAFARLTVAFQRLEDAIRTCDLARTCCDDMKSPAAAIGIQMCLDAESFDLDYIIKAADSLSCLAGSRARQIEDMAKRIKGERP